MSNPITNLNGGVEPVSLDGADLFPIADVSDNTQAPTGTTKPVSLTSLTAYLGANLSIFTDVANGIVPLSGGSATDFLSADGTWKAAGGGDSIYSASGDVFGGAVATMVDAVGLTFKGVNDAGDTLIRGENLTGDEIFKITNRGNITLNSTAATSPLMDFKLLGVDKFKVNSDGSIIRRSSTSTSSLKNDAGQKLMDQTPSGTLQFYQAGLSTKLIQISPIATTYFNQTGAQRFIIGATSGGGSSMFYVNGNSQVDGQLYANGSLRVDDTTVLSKTISTDFLPINVNGVVKYLPLYT